MPLESPWVQKAESCRQRRVNGSVSPPDAMHPQWAFAGCAVQCVSN